MKKLEIENIITAIRTTTTASAPVGSLLDYDLRTDGVSLLPSSKLKLSDLITSDAIKEGLKRELKRRRTPGVDNKSALNLSRELSSARIAEIIGYVNSDQYFPKSLKVVHIPKGLDDYREIAVPAVLDRILQRILSKALATNLEPHLHLSTIGYRSGKCIEDALLLCSRYIQDGYKVVETDIEAFFDSVNRDRLMERLSLINHDPAIATIVKRFLESPRLYHDGKHVPTLGIPQGCALSPVLANLYLIPLDQALVAAGFRYVRYADDLVVFFDPSKEGHPMDVITNGLRRLGLKYKAKKTRMIDPAKGESFRFLGMKIHADGKISHAEDRILKMIGHPQFLNFLKDKKAAWRTKDVANHLIQLGKYLNKNLNFVPNLEFGDHDVESHLDTILIELMTILERQGEIGEKKKKDWVGGRK